MAQPFNRNSALAPAGRFDPRQVWASNPWRIVSEEENLSAYERNQFYLSINSARFPNVSFLTGTDNEGDSRSAVPADLDGDGMQELILRQAGGGPLVVYRNRFPPRHWLRVALRGKKSNGQGIGARVIAETAFGRQSRELYPNNTFSSQRPCEVYFGLGDAAVVDRLTIEWPSGTIQTLDRVAADQLLRVTEAGDGRAASQ